MLFLLKNLKNTFSPHFFCYLLFIHLTACQTLSFHNKKSSTDHNRSVASVLCIFCKKVQKENNTKNTEKLIIDSHFLQSQADLEYLKAEEALHTNKKSEALQFLQKALSYKPKSNHLRTKLANIYFEEGFFSEAVRQYEFLLNQMPSDTKARHLLAEIYAFSDLNQEALKQYQILIQQKPDHFDFQFQKLGLLIREEKWSQSLFELAQLKTSARTKEDKARILFAEAYIYNTTNQNKKYQSKLEEIKNFKPDKEEDILKLSDLYIQNQNLTSAYLVLEDYQNRSENTEEVTQKLFELYKNNKQKQQAYEQANKLKQAGVLNPEQYFYMASFWVEKEQYDKAIPFLKDLITDSLSKNQPHSVQIVNYSKYVLGMIYERMQLSELAIKFYTDIPKQSSYFVSAHIQLAYLFYAENKQKQAIHVLKKLHSHSQITPKVFLLQAQFLFDSNKKKEALKVLTKGLNNGFFHHSPDLLFLRGFYLSQMGKIDLSIKDMEELLKKDPYYDEALNFLAYTYAEQKIDLNKAEKLSKQALSLRPNSAYFLDTMGWIFYQKEDFNQALFFLEKAFSLEKNNSQIVKHLVKVYYQLKEFEKHNLLLKKMIELEADEKKQKNIKESFFTAEI